MAALHALCDCERCYCTLRYSFSLPCPVNRAMDGRTHKQTEHNENDYWRAALLNFANKPATARIYTYYYGKW